MDLYILPELTPESRARLLADSSDGVEEKTFIRPMDDHELASERMRLQDLVEKLDKTEDEAKEVKKQYSEQIKTLRKERRELSLTLKQGGIETTEAVYKIIDREAKMVGYYTRYGFLLMQRPTLKEEMQVRMSLSVNE